MEKIQKLKEIWDSVSLDADFFEKNIIPRYSESHRFYHTIDHIFDLCTAFNSFCNSDKSLSKMTKHAIYYAIFFHDIIYETNSTSNEEDSNKLWLNFSENKVDGKTRILVSQMILATKDHKNIEENYAISVFLDLDLSILGEPSSQKFEEYELNIQKEYSHIDRNLYLKKRYEIMNKIALNKYYTRIGNLKWGMYRKRNMEKYTNIISYFKHFGNVLNSSHNHFQSIDKLKDILIKEYIFKIFFQHNSHIEYLFVKSDVIKYKTHIIKAKHSVKQISQLLQINNWHSSLLRQMIQSNYYSNEYSNPSFVHGICLLIKNPKTIKNKSDFYINNTQLLEYILLKNENFCIQKLFQFKDINSNEPFRSFLYQNKIKISEIEKTTETFKLAEGTFNENLIENLSNCDIFDHISLNFITNGLYLKETLELIDYFFEE